MLTTPNESYACKDKLNASTRRFATQASKMHLSGLCKLTTHLSRTEHMALDDVPTNSGLSLRKHVNHFLMLKIGSFNNVEGGSSTENPRVVVFGNNPATECIPYDSLNGESRGRLFGWGEGRKVAKLTAFPPILLRGHDFMLEALIKS